MIKIKTLITAFLILIPVLISNLYSSQTFRLETPAFLIETSEDGYHQIIINGFHSYQTAGYPDLPSMVYWVAVPPEVEPDSIELTYTIEKTENLGIFNIKEIPPMMTWVDGSYITGDKADIYSTDDFFPGDCVEYAGFSRMRKWRIVTFKYTPFRYNPVTKELIFIAGANVTVDYRLGDRNNDIEWELHDSLMDGRARRSLLNYDESAGWYAPGGGEAPSVIYNYVIITTNAIENSSTKLSDFVIYLMGKGFSPLVITEDEYGGLTGQAPNGTAEKIRKWLIDNYIAYGIDYVLLIGNPDPYDPSITSDSVGDIPMQMCWPRRDYTTYKECPTDYFFADLTGNWDLDGDGYYGEWSDFTGTGGVDFINEVYVGRIPVYSGVTDLDSILQKTMEYGNSANTSWRSSVLLPMSFSTTTYDGAPLAEQMMDDYLTGAGYWTWTQYQQGNGACGLDSIYPSDEELRGGTVVRDRWAANDFGLVVWWAHGSYSSASVGCSGCWDGTLMSTSYAPYLDNNHPAFVFLNSCLNGYPEYSANLQYALLKNGGIGTVGASRVSWFNSGVGYGYFDGSTTNSGIAYEFAKRIAANQPVGNAVYNAKSGMIPESTTRLMNFYDFNLYGDPAMSIATHLQHAITVTSPNGGEAWEIGSTQHITWVTTGTVGDVKIDYSVNNGASWIEIESSTSNDGSYEWTIPDNPSDNCLVLISDNETGLSDVGNDVFSIVLPSSITVTSPNGGEGWEIGSSHNITWTCTGTVGNIKIDYSVNNGASWIEVESGTSNDGSFQWTIPDTPSNECLVRVSDIDGYPLDVSDAVFSILAPPSITVTSPNGGEEWEVGSTHDITWTSTGPVGNIKIEYCTIGRPWTEIVSSTPNDGNYTWTLPMTASDKYLVRVSEAGGEPSDISDDVFTIYIPPSVTVTSPNGGELWEIGSIHNITWTSTPDVGQIRIEYSVNGGNSWKYIIPYTENDGSYNWTVPDNASENCLIRVSERDGYPTDVSDAVFSIGLPSSITVISPNGGEVWEFGSTHDISWTSTGTIVNVTIDYSTNNGSSWTEIIPSTVNDGSYSWTIPDTPSDSCLVRVSETDGNTSDVSDAVFSMVRESITVTSPNGRESLIIGSTHIITWASTGTIDNVMIEYSNDGGISWKTIAAQTANNGSYNWLVPEDPSGSCLVRIKSLDGDKGTWDVSNGEFVIEPSKSEKIAVTSPNGGENLFAGTLHHITWTSTGNIDNVKIEGSIDNGTSWTVITASAPNNGSYEWTIPDTPSSTCLVRVSDMDGEPVDVSDAVFSIGLSSTITVTSPNGGEILNAGSNYNIAWTSSGAIENVTIEYSINGGNSWSNIVDSTSNNGTYNWTVPAAPSENCLVRIRENRSDGGASDVSDSRFAIDASFFNSITVISPNGGETLYRNSTHEITWDTTGTVGDVTIEYSIDNGDNWSMVTSTVNNGTYNWTVPDSPSENCRVRVRETGGDLSDESDAVFEISAETAPSITVTYPNGGESLTTGSTVDITWSAVGPIDNVILEYSTDEGATWTTIAASVVNSGSYNWEVPDTPSENCLIRISGADGDINPRDTSDGVFSIAPTPSPTITVISPNGRETLTIGSIHNITWSTTGTVENVSIEYSTNSGASWAVIVESTENDGSYDWSVPDELSDQCLVKIRGNYFDNGPADTSDAEFSIVPATGTIITVIYPNGGDIVYEGSIHDITWTCPGDTVTDVAIEYSTDNGATWSEIIAATPNDGIYSWVVPGTPSESCLIRIGDMEGNHADVSDAVFTIEPDTYGCGYQGFIYEKYPDGSYGAKIPLVLLTWVSEDGSVTKQVTTDKNGYYRISLSPQRYVVTTKHPDFVDYSSLPGFFVVTGDGYQTGNFFLTRK